MLSRWLRPSVLIRWMVYTARIPPCGVACAVSSVSVVGHCAVRNCSRRPARGRTIGTFTVIIRRAGSCGQRCFLTRLDGCLVTLRGFHPAAGMWLCLLGAGRGSNVRGAVSLMSLYVCHCLRLLADPFLGSLGAEPCFLVLLWR